jgi:hypothetical protein
MNKQLQQASDNMKSIISNIEKPNLFTGSKKINSEQSSWEQSSCEQSSWEQSSWEQSSWEQSKLQKRGWEKIEIDVTNQNYTKQNYIKTMPCKYGKKCTNINCNYAHSEKELRIIPCNYGISCNRYGDNIEIPCQFIHPDESVSDYYKRSGISKPIFEDDSENNIIDKPISDLVNDFENVRVTENKFAKTAPCRHGKKCTNTNCKYAHSESELRIFPCAYGESCNRYHQIKNPNQEIDTSLFPNPCQYIHPNESIDNYYKRSRKPRPVFGENKNIKNKNTPSKKIDLFGSDVNKYALGSACFNVWNYRNDIDRIIEDE